MSPYKSIGLMVVRKGEVAPCGHVRLCDIDWERGTALRSVFTDPDLQRQGIAKEALMELTYGGFTKLGLREVLIRVDPNNTRSISNILKNFSARFVGETQARVAAEEGLHRRHLYSLDRDHFLQFIYPRFVSAQKIRASLSHQFQGHAEDGADYHHFPSCTPDH